MPPVSSPISSSASERIIPSDSTPLSFALFSFMPPGSTAPGRATGTSCPAATFGAPQTIVRSPSPVSTAQTLRRSASGCGSTLLTRPTTNPSGEGAPAAPTRSTSVPVIASCSAIRPVSQPGSQ